MFKAWDKKTERFLPNDPNVYLVAPDGSVLINPDECDSQPEDIVLLRKTGLKDIKRTPDFPDGREIIEGARVRATNKGWSREFEIMWIDYRAKFMVWQKSQPNISFDLTCDTIIEFNVEVIGQYPRLGKDGVSDE
ncbi:MAG: hypothetical protein ACYDG6_06880 [Thermincolia bacterium]